LTEKDKEIIKEALGEFGFSDFKQLKRDLVSPDFNNTGKVHDWKNYIPKAYVKNWASLDVNTKLAMYVIAEQVASNEEWD